MRNAVRSSFPIHDADRSIPAAPGARQRLATEDAVRALLQGLLARDEALGGAFQRIGDASDVDDDPDLGPWLSLIRARALPTLGLAILPPALRFHAGGLWMFAVQPGGHVNGYGLGPASFRDEATVFAFSDNGLLAPQEFSSVGEWLLELLGPLLKLTVPPEQRDAASAAADELWRRIEGDLPLPEPRAAASMEDVSVNGVVVAETAVVDGKRHGLHRRYALVEEQADVDLDDPDAEFPDAAWRRGPLIEEGNFVRGFAQGPFQFFDDSGRLLQEVTYKDGFPEGRATVHPFAATGLCEAATVNYEQGVPTSWTIPPSAFRSAALARADGTTTTLAELAHDAPLLLLDCAQAREFPLSASDAAELEAVPNLVLVGLHPDTAGRGKLGTCEFELVADPGGRLLLAYGHDHRLWLPATCFSADGRLLGALRLNGLRRLASRFAGR